MESTPKKCEKLAEIEVSLKPTERFSVVATIGFMKRTTARLLPPLPSLNASPHTGTANYAIRKSNELGAAVMDAARNARILFIGDTRQHVSVEAGDFLRVLEKHSKLRSSGLKDIRFRTSL